MSAVAGSPLLVQHFDVFARSPGGGNPCPVVPAPAGLSAAWMQGIAAHYGQETGFVLRDEDGWALRFFVPRHEMAICVHATVAAGALAAHLADRARPAAESWLGVDVDQGDAMGRPSWLHGSALAGPDGVRRSTVRGQARLRSTEQLDLATLPAPPPGLVPELR